MVILVLEKHRFFSSIYSKLVRYAEGSFSNQHMATVGIEYFLKEEIIGDKTVRIKIWDTAGQEQYKSLTKNFYKKCHGIVIVYDVTDVDSFNNISDWFKNAREFSEENINMILIGNKIDLLRQVPKEDAIALSEKLEIKYFETSAKTNIGITESIRYLISEIMGGNCTYQNTNKILELKRIEPLTPKRSCNC